MKAKRFRHLANWVFVYIYVISTPSVLADCGDVSGQDSNNDSPCTGDQSLGSPENRTDVFRLTCPFGTQNAVARVWDRSPPNNGSVRMRVKVSKGGIYDSKTDNNPGNDDGEEGGPSNQAIRDGGANDYTVAFYKTNAGAESYRGEARCNPASNIMIFQRTQNEQP